MVEHSGVILLIFSASIPFILMFVNASFFLQSIRRPHIAMYGVVTANLINIMINPVLVYGLLGFPELGARGSATSTLIVRIFLVVYIFLYLHKMRKNPKLNKRFGLDRPNWIWGRHYHSCNQWLLLNCQQLCRLARRRNDGLFCNLI